MGMSPTDPLKPTRTHRIDNIPTPNRRALLASTRATLSAMRYGILVLMSILLTSVPVWAQVDSADEARSLEGIGIIESFVYLLMAIVPIIALIIVLGSFIGLMSTTNPQKKTDIKAVRNQAILYGWILAPALGVIIGLLGSLTGNPVLESLNI